MNDDPTDADALAAARRRTQQRIFDAFARLFARENYADITVRQIIREAGIGHSTFYDHYASKEALLDDLCAETFRHIAMAPRTALRDHGFEQQQGELMPALAHLLFHLREDNARLRGLLTGASAGLFLRKLEPYLRDLMRASLEHRAWSGTVPDVPEEFVLNHLVGSFNAAVKWWVSQDFEQSPLEIAGYLQAMLPAQIMHVALNEHDDARTLR